MPGLTLIARALDCQTFAVKMSNLEQYLPVSFVNLLLVSLMWSREISNKKVTKGWVVKDGGGRSDGRLGGLVMLSLHQMGLIAGRGRPLAMSAIASTNRAAPRPSNIAWLDLMPTTNPPHLNSVTYTCKERKN